MQKIRKNDTVAVITGKDKGKTARVLSVSYKNFKILVEGVNFIKRHARRTSQQQQQQQSGITQKEAPIALSNVLLFCKTCSKPSRVGINTLADGSKARFCKRCKEIID